MRRKSYELWLALFAILFITVVYLFVMAVYGQVPAASGFYGHAMGVFGFLLMLLTEVAYTLRKRSRRAFWGPVADWLQFHIFTGLVGPYMVLLHSSWKFNGVAGVLTLLMLVIVASGFVGRYIYTAVPRTLEGQMVEKAVLESQIAVLETDLAAQAARVDISSPLMERRLALQPGPADAARAKAGGLRGWEDRLEWRASVRRMTLDQRQAAARLDALLARRKTLRRQLDSLATTRQLMAVWHAVHIPLGLGLFGLSFVHIAAAIYYADLIH